MRDGQPPRAEPAAAPQRKIEIEHAWTPATAGAAAELAFERLEARQQGRGIELMRAVVDRVRFVSKPEAGTIVHLEKSVAYAEDSVGRGRLSPST